MKFTAIVCLLGATLTQGSSCPLSKVCGTTACTCASGDDCDGTDKVCAEDSSTRTVMTIPASDLANRAEGTGASYCVQGGTRTTGKYAKACAATEVCNQSPHDSSAATTANDKEGLCVSKDKVLSHGQKTDGAKKVCIGTGATIDCTATQHCNVAGTTAGKNDLATSVCIEEANMLLDKKMPNGAKKICFGTDVAFVCNANEKCTATGTDKMTTCAPSAAFVPTVIIACVITSLFA